MAKTTKKTKKRPPLKKQESASKAAHKKTASGKSRKSATLKQHFEEAGVRFDMKPKEVLARLKQLMGRKRYSDWHSASLGHQQGWGRADAEYEMLQSAEEVNTLFSLQSNVSLPICEWLSAQVAGSVHKKSHIGDLGCGAGVLSAWLAKQHPSCRVTGWDAVGNMVQAAVSSQEFPNLAFGTWNYAQAPCPKRQSCDVLVSCFGIDFPFDQVSHRQSPEGKPFREVPYYHKMLNALRPIFRGWRSAVVDQGVLHAVLRIPEPAVFLATIDASHHEGWSLDIGQYKYLSIGLESFPAMTFRPAAAPLLSEEAALSLWSRHSLRANFAEEIADPAAVCVFRSLENKTVLKSASRTYDDGHVMEALVGTAGFLGFQYTYATTGFTRLKLMSIDEAERAEPWFPQPSFDDMFF